MESPMASLQKSLSSPSASPPDLDDSNVLTPSRKVKALLAQFDDSDSDRVSPVKNVKAVTHNDEFLSHILRSQSQHSDDEVVPHGPRGRLASRMQQVPSSKDLYGSSKRATGADAYTRIKGNIAQMSKPKEPALKAVDDNSSGDELQITAPKRRLIQKKTTDTGDCLSRQRSRSPSPLFFPSPSTAKLVGKSPSSDSSSHVSDPEDIPDDVSKPKSAKFLALVEKHQKQRIAREKADEAKRAERLEMLKKAGSRVSSSLGPGTLSFLSDDSDNSDGNAGQRLTQQARPTRKASKKALEEMSRETQRMSRSMQLAHQARTKKKITKESLLARFNFVAPGSDVNRPTNTGHADTTASSAPSSDVEGAKENKTPPTSPLQFEDKEPAMEAQNSPVTVASTTRAEEELSTVEGLLVSRPTALDKGKGKVIAVDEVDEVEKQVGKNSSKPRVRPIRVRWSKQDAIMARGADSDSDLEIVTSKSTCKKLTAFETLPQSRSRDTSSHLILRSLAHLQTRGTDEKHACVNRAQMEAQLRRAARMQALKERQEKLEELKSKGIFIQTAEERQKEQEDVEDLVERARVEGAELQRREKQMAKQDGTFVRDKLDDDDSDEEDVDFEDELEELEDELSGSEEEVEEEGEEKAEGEGGGEEVTEEDEADKLEHEIDDSPKMDPLTAADETDLIDREADEVQLDKDENIAAEDGDGNEPVKENQPPRIHTRRRNLILSDEEDDEEEDEDILPLPSPQKVKTPQSVLRSARKIIPGLQMSNDLPIGLTQAFAATMADAESQDVETDTQEQESLALTRDLPSPHFNTIPPLNRLESLDIITDSQPTAQTQPLDLDLSTTQAVPQSPAAMSSTQFSFMPTQDVGYVMSPFKENRFDTPLAPPHSTVDTVILPPEQSPILQRKGRLRRGRAMADSDDETVENNRLTGHGLDQSAFAVMQRAAKNTDKKILFDKSTFLAKEMVDDAAEESEDEYAGLGGASDDEEGEEDEADRQLIDHDESLGHGDESKLAGFYA
jgi:mediator of replication checkpoint protein 1